MNKFPPILAGILIWVPQVLFSQELSDYKLKSIKPDSLVFDSVAYSKAVGNLLLKSFQTVATGQGEGSNFATYGSFEPLNGTYKFNFFGTAGKPERPFLFNVSVKGDIIGDNIGVLFNNSKFNTGTTISGKFHIPLKGQNIEIDGDQRQAAIDKVKLLRKVVDDKLADLLKDNNLTYLNNQYVNNNFKWDKANDTYVSKSRSLDSLNKLIDNGHKSGMDPVKLNLMIEKSLELTKELKVQEKIRSDLRFKIDSIKPLLKYRQPDNNYKIQKARLENVFNTKRDSIYLAIPVLAQSTQWISLVGGFNRSNYYSFNNKLPFPEQLKEVSHDNFQFGVELNWFISTGPYWPPGMPNTEPKPVRIQMINFGIVRMGASDIDDYSTMEMTQSRKSVLADTTNTLGKKYNVYTDSIQEFKAWKIYLNYYYSLGKNNSMALHAFPEVQFRDSHKNPLNLGIGLIKSIKNRKDNAAFNVEIYAKFKDIGKALPQKEASFLNRNEIGLNFAVPLNLVKK